MIGDVAAKDIGLLAPEGHGADNPNGSSSSKSPRVAGETGVSEERPVGDIETRDIELFAPEGHGANSPHRYPS